MASARSVGYAGSRRGDASTRAARWASRPRRGSTGGEAGAGARPGGARGALLERARRRGSLSRGRARGGAGSGGGGSGWASMATPSSASRKSKLRQWRLLKGTGAAGRAMERSHGGGLDPGPGAATLMSWYTVDTSRSGGSVRVILKEVSGLQLTQPCGAFSLGGDASQGSPSAAQARRTPSAGPAYLGHSGQGSPRCGPWRRPQALAPCWHQKHLQEELSCPATQVLPPHPDGPFWATFCWDEAGQPEGTPLKWFLSSCTH